MPGNFTKNKNDLAQILFNAANNNLSRNRIRWFKNICMTVVLCSKGYPGSYKKNVKIANLEKGKLKIFKLYTQAHLK